MRAGAAATVLAATVPPGAREPRGIVADPAGRRVYVANFNKDGDGSVASYRVAEDGTLGPLRGPVPTGGRQPDLTSITLAQSAP
ncbi:hypothetical protein [Kribbella sp. NPDC051770]|uniref:hypothetical protein n=1 Tax=Kribbella sp. NPDC051770 TaxID=3155413 RepID=UPI003426DFC2